MNKSSECSISGSIRLCLTIKVKIPAKYFHVFFENIACGVTATFLWKQLDGEIENMSKHETVTNPRLLLSSAKMEKNDAREFRTTGCVTRHV
jgi:hypothetical protein